MALKIFGKLGKWRDGTQDLGDAFNEDASFSIAIIGKNPVVYSHDGNDYEDFNLQEVIRDKTHLLKVYIKKYYQKNKTFKDISDNEDVNIQVMRKNCDHGTSGAVAILSKTTNLHIKEVHAGVV